VATAKIALPHGGGIMSIETSVSLLRRVSEPVDPTTENLEIYFQQLESEIKAHENGVGLAGVQIGILKRVAIIRPNPKDNSKITRLWNPEIVEQSGQIIHPEGCLSVPGMGKSVTRYLDLTIRNGDGILLVAEGFEAVIAQHEIDHMNGITIRDKDYRSLQVGRNEPCPCGKRTPQGGIVKFKKCHLGKELELMQMQVTGGTQ
jgi:peptide deformylase